MSAGWDAVSGALGSSIVSLNGSRDVLALRLAAPTPPTALDRSPPIAAASGGPAPSGGAGGGSGVKELVLGGKDLAMPVAIWLPCSGSTLTTLDLRQAAPPLPPADTPSKPSHFLHPPL
jgi:hypothetical protein